MISISFKQLLNANVDTSLVQLMKAPSPIIIASENGASFIIIPFDKNNIIYTETRSNEAVIEE